MAAGVVLGYLKYVLGFDSIAFRKGMDEAERQLVAKQKSFIKQGEKLQSLGKSMAAFITLPLAGLAAAGIKEAQDTAHAMGQVNAALSSMGPVAGKTAGQLKAAAMAFEKSSLFEADQILTKVTANMLTFGTVSGENFDRAQQAAINLSARLGQDLQVSAIQVGKALNDPIRGLTSLRRVGIQFTEQQEEQIKAMVAAGDAAGAQRVILAELERQFGGAAQAAQDADPWNKLTDAFKNTAEAIGNALLPILPPLTNAITGVLNAFSSLSPETQKWLIIAGGAVAVLGPVLAVVGSLVTILGPLLPLIVKLGPAWAALSTAIAAARVAALAALPALTPFLVPLGALAVAVGAVYLAWKNWDKITAIVQAVYTAVKTWLVDKFNAIVASIKSKVDAVTGFFHDMWDKVVGHSYVPDMVDAIGQHFGRLGQVMVAPAQAAIQAVKDGFAGMGGDVADANEDILVSARRTTADVIDAFGQMASSTIGSVKDMVATFKSGDILGGVKQFLDLVLNVVQALGQIGVLKGPATTPPIAGTRAAGGPVVPGRTYLVGENGPEFVTPRRSGYVHPNGSGGAARVLVVPSPYFDVVVDGRAQRVAAPMVGQGVVAAVGGGEMRQMRRQRRAIP